MADSHKTGRREVRHGAPPDTSTDFVCWAQVRASLLGSCAQKKPSLTHKLFKRRPKERSTTEPATKSASTRSPGRFPVPPKPKNKRLFLNQSLQPQTRGSYRGSSSKTDHAFIGALTRFWSPLPYADLTKRPKTQRNVTGRSDALPEPTLAQKIARGKRERSPPLPQIMQSSFPHLGKSHVCIAWIFR